MRPTVFQKAEIRDENDVIVQQGTYGKGSALSNSTNDGWVDYVMNNLEFLYGLAKDEVVPVSALPASGDMNKTYLLTTTGVCYRWDGTAWVEISSSEAVGRAEAAANLSEQWATKTDGTVADNEYSAKHYANAAQQSADDAQDVADDMADHLAQIDQNTGGVSANSKRIGNIEKLLQGNLYDYDTDDDTSYIKSVPSGAMPYAGLEKVGGKTVVWNQLVASNNGGTPNGCSRTVSDGVVTCTIDSLSNSIGCYFTGVQNGTHVMMVSAEVSLPYTASVRVGIGSVFTTETVTANKPTLVSCIVNKVVGSPIVYVDTKSDYSVGDSFSFRLNVCDLTLMFGAGNEPTTVAEFEAMFPASYYAYNAGTLLSAGVTSVESISNNLWANDDYNVTSNTGITKVGTNALTVERFAYQENYNFYPINGSAGERFTFSAKMETLAINSNNASFKISFVYDDNTYSEYGKGLESVGYKQTIIITSPQNGKSVVGLTIGKWSYEGTVSITEIKLEKGISATSYKPHIFFTYPIPATVRALTGYGWSAGSVYNYIDFERKVLVKNVGRIVLNGTQSLALVNWQPLTNSVGWGYGNNLIPMKKKYNNEIFNIVSDRLPATRYSGTNNIYSTDSPAISGIDNANYSLFVRVADTSLTTESAINAYLSANPITVYYELQTPIETDISEYLTDDNLINVESGGTLTFPNSNGDDYQIPVPSTEKYMIDLQSALGD